MSIIERIRSLLAQDKPFYSFEFFPPRTERGMQNIYLRLDRMKTLNPVFVDVTWGAGGTTADSTQRVSETFVKYNGVPVMMHLTCTNMERQSILDALDVAKRSGIRTILALRGDPPQGSETFVATDSGFRYAADLVRFIRQEYGDYFCIAVAGYPRPHMEAPSAEADLQHLKEKVDAGADFVVSQFFFEVSEFTEFVAKCRALGITCPILPGIIPFLTYQGIARMCHISGIEIPQSLHDRLLAVKDDNEAIAAIGVEFATNQCRLLHAEGFRAFHFYCLNTERSTQRVLDNLGWTQHVDYSTRALPWHTHANAQPFGREDDEAAAISAPIPVASLNILQSQLMPGALPGERKFVDMRCAWGDKLEAQSDLAQAFVKYFQGTTTRTPWCALPPRFGPATTEQLIALARAGVLVTTAIPRFDGASSDSVHGWGGADGTIQQRAYVQCLAPLEVVTGLSVALSSGDILFRANNTAESVVTNMRAEEAIEMHVGTFDGKRVVATVFDPATAGPAEDAVLSVLLGEWASIYPVPEEGEEADLVAERSRAVLQEAHAQLFVISLVHKDPEGSLESLLSALQAAL